MTFREGLRARADDGQAPDASAGTDVDPKAFYDLVTKPTDALLGDYPWLLDENVRPKGASLEGFLYPATYTLRVGDEDPTDGRGPRPDDARRVLRPRRARTGSTSPRSAASRSTRC